MAPHRLDKLIAQNLMRWRTLEAAMHSEGPWAFRWRGSFYEVETSWDDDSVFFTGTIGDPGEGPLELTHRGETMLVRPLRLIGDELGHEVSWRLAVAPTGQHAA